MSNRITKILGIQKPIIQGPLFWLTNAEMVAAVSNAGGLGTLGINAGQYQPSPHHTHQETVEHMREQIRRTQALTDQPFGLNLIFADDPAKDEHADMMINLMIEEHVPVAVIYANHYVAPWFEKLRAHNIKIVYRPATPTKEVVMEAVNRGVDIIVATGFDEGGTVPQKVVGTFSAVPYVVDVVQGRVPVMAAGGITDERTARAVFALGAEGLFAGTAFLMTKESPLNDQIKQLALKSDAYDQVLYKAVPKYYRSLPGPLPDKLVKMSTEGKSNTEVWAAAQGYRGMREGMINGDLEHGYASFGLGISFIKTIRSVKEVVAQLAAGIPKEQQ